MYCDVIEPVSPLENLASNSLISGGLLGQWPLNSKTFAPVVNQASGKLIKKTFAPAVNQASGKLISKEALTRVVN